MTNIQPRKVCVVGAGPAGLVAAKVFGQHEGFSVTVFEAADRVGGMWRGRLGEFGDKCAPDMKTNLSRYTVAFSDLSWSSVFPSDPASSYKAPLFPQAYQVGTYLETYSARFGLDSVLKLNKRVVKAKLDKNVGSWEITTQDTISGQTYRSNFDYLIIASGFFDKPGRSFDPSPGKSMTNIQHTSRFRTLSSLTKEPGKIAVIGGGISGAEAAANAAFQISNAIAKSDTLKAAHASSKIYHVVNRPLYLLPRYLPHFPGHSHVEQSDPAPEFLPLDLILYNLSRRGDDEITAATTTVSPEKARKGHEFLRALLGGDQSDLGHPELVYKGGQTKYPGYTGITDTYAEFVRSGFIVPVRGWVDQVEQHKDEPIFDILLKQYDPWYHAQAKEPTATTAIRDVVGIIEATGYRVGLDYLDTDVKDKLEHDIRCPRIPFLFTQGSTIGLPTLAAVGFYEGPFWGVMEMQARYILGLWAHEPTSPGIVADISGHRIVWSTAAREIREALNSANSLQVPQFWMSDYVGFMEEFAREAGLTRDDSLFCRKKGPVFPARYQSGSTGTDAMVVSDEVSDLMHESRNGTRFVPAAVFRGMQGTWRLYRNIVSHNATLPSRKYVGIAQILPRVPLDSAATAEHLYTEETAPIIDNGHSYPNLHRWGCAYYEGSDKVITTFAGCKDASNAHSGLWTFYVPEEPQHGWKANSSHQFCGPDTYHTEYEFKFRGASLETFCIYHRVTGPGKDYTDETWYKRPEGRNPSQEEVTGDTKNTQ